MRAYERRWVRVILGSFAAEESPGLAPRPGEVDYEGTFAGMRERARPLARVGMRAALWLAALSPLFVAQRPRTLAQLPLDERQAILGALLVHRWFFVREAAFLLKLAACLALFASDAVRARSGYDPTALVALTPAKGRSSR